MRIGLTQRVELVEGYGERRDCLDQQWATLLASLGHSPIPVPNALQEPQAWFQRVGVDGFILTGGNDLAGLPNASRPAPERDMTEWALLDYAGERQMPVLGVCRGFQVMNVYLGGRLVPVSGHVASRHAVERVSESSFFTGYSRVNSFHDWGLDKQGLSDMLIPILCGYDGTIEAARHAKLPWFGMMWHPERESPFAPADLALLEQIFEEAE